IIERATRSLVKAGHPGVFELLGHGGAAHVRVQNLAVTPRRVCLGGSIEICFTLTSRSKRRESLVVDYAIYHQKADGSMRPKVFKLRTLTLDKGSSVEIRKRHTLRAISTRRYYRGAHAVEILVNGQPLAKTKFTLTLPKT
ncbi:MAG TPA: hypothetical protein PKD61_14120, partial [Polyangiaceae bacterium]|nr:hypothetical protein [Polyangiaceae bacterium]